MRSRALTRSLAALSMAGAVVATVLIGALHLIPPTAWVSPVRRTISEYALHETGWVFDLAITALAVGSVAGWAALIGARLIAPASAGSIALLLWSAGMAGVVLFPKHNWSVGPSMSGDIHRAASLLGALSLPLAALLVARAWRGHPRWRAHAAWVGALGLLCLLCFSPIVYAFLSEPVTGVRWWRAIPLGAVERAMGMSWVITVGALAWWAARAGGSSDAPVSVDTPPVVANRINVAMRRAPDG